MPASLKGTFKTGDKKARRKRVPLVRPLCDRCGNVMTVYTTRTVGTSVVRYFRCWNWPKCRYTKRLDGG